MNEVVNMERLEQSTHAVAEKFSRYFPNQNHPGNAKLRQLSILLKDPLFREIYQYNCEHSSGATRSPKQEDSINQQTTNTLPDNFYRVVYPARPGSAWGFSVGAVELNGEENEVSIPEQGEPVSKLVVDGVEPANVDREEAHLRMMIRPGDELVQINRHVIQSPKHFKTLASQLSSRDEPVEFVFEQSLSSGTSLNKSIIRFQEQRLGITLDAGGEARGSFGFAIVSSGGVTLVEKVVKEGCAWKDGRLRKGDIIISINNVAIAGLSSNEVVAVLKSCGTKAHLCIVRHERLDYPIRFDLNLNHHFHVTLSKQHASLGINIRSPPGSRDLKDERLFIKDVVPGSVADQCGMIQHMDQIVAVNGQCIVHLTKDQSLQLLKENNQEVHLTFLREVEMLPPSNRASEAILATGSLDSRKEEYRNLLGEDFEVYDCEVSVDHLKMMMKQFRDQQGNLRFTIDKAPKARQSAAYARYNRGVSLYPVESGDELLEVGQVKLADLEQKGANILEMLSGMDSNKLVTIVYCRHSSHEYSQPMRNADFSANQIRLGLFETEGGFEGDQSRQTDEPTPRGSRSRKEIPLQVYRPDRYQDITRSDLSEIGSLDTQSRSNQHTKSTSKSSGMNNSASEANSSRLNAAVGQKGNTYTRNEQPTQPKSPQRVPEQGPLYQPNKRQNSPLTKTPYNRYTLYSVKSGSGTWNGEAEYDDLRRSKMTEYGEFFPDTELSSIHSKTETVPDSKTQPNDPDLSSAQSPGDTSGVSETLNFQESCWEKSVEFCLIRKIAGQSMGLKVCQVYLDSGDPVIVVQEIVEGSEASKARILRGNDRIVQVENYDTSRCEGQDFVSLMNRLPDIPISLGIRKFIPPTSVDANASREVAASEQKAENESLPYESQDENEIEKPAEVLTEESVKDEPSDKPLLKNAQKKLQSGLAESSRHRVVSSPSDAATDNLNSIGGPGKKNYQILDNTLSTNKDDSFESHQHQLNVLTPPATDSFAQLNSTEKSSTYDVSNASNAQNRQSRTTALQIKQDAQATREMVQKLNPTPKHETEPSELAEDEQDGGDDEQSMYETWPVGLQRRVVIEKQPKQRMGMGLVSPYEKTSSIASLPVANAGMLVKTITEEGLIGQDARIQEGDFLLAINGYTLSSSAGELQDIMQMANSDPKFTHRVELLFVPREEADFFLQHGTLPTITSTITTLTPRNTLEPNTLQAAEAYMEEVPSSAENLKSDAASTAQRQITGEQPSGEEEGEGEEPDFDQVTLGPKRFVEVAKGEDEPLGISIVDYSIGIVVQSVREGSAADLKGPERIEPWDRLTSVNGQDLTKVSREQAIQVIKSCRSPLRFVVQSIMFSPPAPLNEKDAHQLIDNKMQHLVGNDEEDDFDDNEDSFTSQSVSEYN